MCAKYVKKKKRRNTGLIIAFVLVAVLLVVVLLLVWGLNSSGQMPSGAPSADTGLPGASTGTLSTDTDLPGASSGESATESASEGEPEQMEYYLGKGLFLQEAAKYTGIYMEDGTDEVVSDVLMLIVRNDGEQDIQYAELTVPTANGDAYFTLSTLPVGERIVLLEENRMPWSANEDYSGVTAENIVVFSESLSLCEDKMSLQAMDGVINITNITGEDITGDIVIYYKNAAADLLYGGITYRIRLEGGLKAGEIRQIMASHFTQSGSRIMFVTIG